ncbi:MAG: UvrB/UvrC motif-containing protein [Bacillota bacterium]
MLCQECRKRAATVHVTQVVNQTKTEKHLCSECARQMGEFEFALSPSFNINSLLASMFNLEPQLAAGSRLRCENCGLTFPEFGKAGRLGCSQCYAEFRPRLEPLLRRVHGASVHTGKVPSRTGGAVRAKKEIEDLRRQLAQAVQAEEFERAARLRDEIRSKETQLT